MTDETKQTKEEGFGSAVAAVFGGAGIIAALVTAWLLCAHYGVEDPVSIGLAMFVAFWLLSTMYMVLFFLFGVAFLVVLAWVLDTFFS